MGYLHIGNLYKAQDVLLFKECYALEKIHGTSAHVSWKDDTLGFFSGGAKHETFVGLFDHATLVEKFKAVGVSQLTVYGEAYGGKLQGMRDTYGADMRFVAFDVRIDGLWLAVPQMGQLCRDLGFDVVDWTKISTDLDSIDAERDKPSVQAIKCGCGDGKLREGIVLRPLIEVRKNNDERIIAKHKGDAFAERVHTPKVRPNKLEVLTEANAIADEWVTEMRLAHVLDKVNPCGIEDTKKVIDAMVEDVEREAAGEVEFGKAAKRAVCRAAAQMFKRRLQAVLREQS